MFLGNWKPLNPATIALKIGLSLAFQQGKKPAQLLVPNPMLLSRIRCDGFFSPRLKTHDESLMYGVSLPRIGLGAEEEPSHFGGKLFGSFEFGFLKFWVVPCFVRQLGLLGFRGPSSWWKLTETAVFQVLSFFGRFLVSNPKIDRFLLFWMLQFLLC